MISAHAFGNSGRKLKPELPEIMGSEDSCCITKKFRINVYYPSNIIINFWVTSHFKVIINFQFLFGSDFYCPFLHTCLHTTIQILQHENNVN